MNYFHIKFPFSTFNDRQMCLVISFTSEKIPTGLSNDSCFLATQTIADKDDVIRYYEGTLSGDVVSKDDERDDKFTPMCGSKLSFNIVCSGLPTWLASLCENVFSVKVTVYADEGAQSMERWRGFIIPQTLNMTVVDELLVCPLVAVDEITATKYIKFGECWTGSGHASLLRIFEEWWFYVHRLNFAQVYSQLGLNSMGFLMFDKNITYTDDSDNDVEDVFPELNLNLSKYINDEEATFGNVFEDVLTYLGVQWTVGAWGLQAINDNYIISAGRAGTYKRFIFHMNEIYPESYETTSQFATIANPEKVGGDCQINIDPDQWKGCEVTSEPHRPEAHQYLVDEDYPIIKANSGYSYSMKRWGGVDENDDNKFADLDYHKFYYLKPTDKEKDFVDIAPCQYGQGYLVCQDGFMQYDNITSCEGKTEPDADCAGSLDFIKFMEGFVAAKFGKFHFRNASEDTKLKNYFLMLNHVWGYLFVKDNGRMAVNMVNPHYHDASWMTLFPFGKLDIIHSNGKHYLKIDFTIVFMAQNVKISTVADNVQSDPVKATMHDAETIFPSVDSHIEILAGEHMKIQPQIQLRVSIGDYYLDNGTFVYVAPSDPKPITRIYVDANQDVVINSIGEETYELKSYMYMECHASQNEAKEFAPMYELTNLSSSSHPLEGKLKVEFMGMADVISYTMEKLLSAYFPCSFPFVAISDVDITFTDDSEIAGTDISNKNTVYSDEHSISKDMKKISLNMASPRYNGFFDNCLLFDGGSYWHNLCWVGRQGDSFRWSLEEELATRVSQQYSAPNVEIEFSKEFNAHDDAGIYNNNFTVNGLTEISGNFKPICRTFYWNREQVRWKLQRQN